MHVKSPEEHLYVTLAQSVLRLLVSYNLGANKTTTIRVLYYHDLSYHFSLFFISTVSPTVRN